jgi:hypothetical protein
MISLYLPEEIRLVAISRAFESCLEETGPYVCRYVVVQPYFRAKDDS